jgi:hypothetical protein
MEKQILHTYLFKAKQAYRNNNLEFARDFCDLGILYLSSKRNEGYTPEDLIEGIKLDLWLSRFWCFLEDKGLLL